MIRIRRMQELGGLTASIGSLKSPDITDVEVELLDKYRHSAEPLPSSEFKIEVSMQDPIYLQFPSDLYTVEEIWLCAPMFSLLRFEDFY